MALMLLGLLAVAPLLYALALLALPAHPIAGKRVCLLIAHPDDEAMFFSPTVLGLTHADARNEVTILCLSAGDAAGLGSTRRRELVKSALILGLKSESDVVVLDTPDFPDSMTASWDADKIRSALSRHTPFDVLITFDEGGVSSHPNHMSLYHGARSYAASSGGKVGLYALVSVGLGRKYAGVLDAALTALSGRGVVYAGGRGGWEAMTRAHVSQMVWFRYLWLGFSRYMLVNELKAILP